MDKLTKYVENEADEAVMRSKRQEHSVNQDNVLKVVDDALAVEEVHGCSEPVPVEALGGPERASTARDVGNGNDLFEGDDLDGCDNGNHINVAHKERREEDSNHDKCPDSARPEVCLFLFVLGLDVFLGGLLLLAYVSIRARGAQPP